MEELWLLGVIYCCWVYHDLENADLHWLEALNIVWLVFEFSDIEFVIVLSWPLNLSLLHLWDLHISCQWKFFHVDGGNLTRSSLVSLFPESLGNSLDINVCRFVLLIQVLETGYELVLTCWEGNEFYWVLNTRLLKFSGQVCVVRRSLDLRETESKEDLSRFLDKLLEFALFWSGTVED